MPTFRNRALLRPMPRQQLNGLSNVFEDISNWAGGAKGDAKQWLDENIGGGAGNIAEGIGNEAVNYGKDIATQTANEQISKMLTPGGGNTTSSPPIQQTTSPTIRQTTPPPIQQTTTQQQTTQNNQNKNFVQRINPLYTIAAGGIILGVTTKSPMWSIFGAIAAGIAHHAYNVNRQ